MEMRSSTVRHSHSCPPSGLKGRTCKLHCWPKKLSKGIIGVCPSSCQAAVGCPLVGLQCISGRPVTCCATLCAAGRRTCYSPAPAQRSPLPLMHRWKAWSCLSCGSQPAKRQPHNTTAQAALFTATLHTCSGCSWALGTAATCLQPP